MLLSGIAYLPTCNMRIIIIIPYIQKLEDLQSLTSSPNAEMLSTLRPVGSCVFTRYNMLAVLSISMRNLIMQEFSRMLVRFKMAQPESFTTLFLERQPGRYHGTLFMLPNPNTSSLICISETILKMTGCISQGLISDRLLACRPTNGR